MNTINHSARSSRVMTDMIEGILEWLRPRGVIQAVRPAHECRGQRKPASPCTDTLNKKTPTDGRSGSPKG